MSRCVTLQPQLQVQSMHQLCADAKIPACHVSHPQVSTDGPRDYRMVVQRLYEREPQLAMGRFRRR